MSREEEEAVLHITAHYVEELREGRQPRLSDYLLRYPQYADAITEFVTYYHALEVEVPVEAPVASKEVSRASILPLSEGSRMAMDRAWNRLSQAGGVGSNSSMTLQLAASKRQKSLLQLAGEVGISVDIMEKLAQSMIDVATIPKEILKRLAQALVEPLGAVSHSDAELSRGGRAKPEFVKWAERCVARNTGRGRVIEVSGREGRGGRCRETTPKRGEEVVPGSAPVGEGHRVFLFLAY